MAAQSKEIEHRYIEIRDNLRSEIVDLEEKIDYLQNGNQPFFTQARKLEEKRAELESVEKFIKSRK